MREVKFQTVSWTEGPSRFWGAVAQRLGANEPGAVRRQVTLPLKICRFKTAKLPRPLRRALLSLLEGMDGDRLIEDMRRHRSYWIWVGEFLHPHEYAARFPKVAHAFRILRKQAPDGTPAPLFRGWYGRVEQAVRAKDVPALVDVLAERPGELARRMDHALRLAETDAVRERVMAAFTGRIGAMATPVLLTLRSHFSTRAAMADFRLFWPKGNVARGVSTPDERVALPQNAIEPLVRAVESELLRRFAAKPAFDACLIDDKLRSIIVPFNERTASESAIALPRGSHVTVDSSNVVRLFLHWCQPEENGATDLDLSVAFYDDRWQYVGVCSYYELELAGNDGEAIARSAGDLRNAPPPDGATEFIDIHRDPAVAQGFRYAVMVVNNYAGLPFSLLERAFAGLMLRDDPRGEHFDPRTVQMKFALNGENGIFLPLVFDLRDCRLHWLDVHAQGRFEMNNVENSKRAIVKICPEMMAYFAGGGRPSMFDLALLHAAARCRRVWIRGTGVGEFRRADGETIETFHARLVRAVSDPPQSQIPGTDSPPLLAMLYQGDVDLPDGSSAYALFRDRVTPTLTAGDLLS